MKKRDPKTVVFDGRWCFLCNRTTSYTNVLLSLKKKNSVQSTKWTGLGVVTTKPPDDCARTSKTYSCSHKTNSGKKTIKVRILLVFGDKETGSCRIHHYNDKKIKALKKIKDIHENDKRYINYPSLLEEVCLLWLLPYNCL